MDITDLKKIAYLARLNIDETDISKFNDDFEKILEFISRLDEIDLDGVEPMAHPLDLSQRLRPDQPKDSQQRDVFQNLSSKNEDGYYLVPKVID